MLKVRALFVLSCGFCLLFFFSCSPPPDDDDSLTPTEVPPETDDQDEDGYNSLDSGGDDCDDNNADIHPDADEVCDAEGSDPVDNDCDGDVDEGVTHTYYADADGDTYGTMDTSTDTCDSEPPDGYVNDATDCDDADSGINPGATEVCDPLDLDPRAGRSSATT